MDLEDDKNVVPASEIAHRTRLRERWELASVLNFLTVFEPLIQSKLKVSAEDVEMAIIEPNDLLSKLHVMLLKGIPPVSKNLNRSNDWVSALCKKLSEWWPWVADGDVPLTVNKGKEISEYKELEPTTRLVVLKALCEIRLIQDDAVSFINNAMKTGSEVSAFRKDKICGDEKGTSYWLDGDASIGYRLYKEVRTFESKQKDQGKGILRTINIQWETIATNLKEFRKVVAEFSSSKIRLEVNVGKTVEANVVPVLEILQTKKERALKQKRREEMLLSDLRNSSFTRTSRTRKAVNYTYDEYEKAISEAISISMQEKTKKRKTTKDREHVKKHNNDKKKTETSSEESSRSEVKRREKSKHSDSKKETRTTSQESSDSDMKSQDDIASESETESDLHQGGDIEDNSDVEYDDINDAISEDGSYSDYSDKENNNPGNRNHATYARRRVGLRWSKRVAGVDSSPDQEISNQGAKERPRRKPTRKSSLESFVAPDSEEASSPADSSDTSSSENLSDDIDS